MDASFAVHGDAKSQTAYGFSMGAGLFFCKSVKQRIITKSSTEAELVAANEATSSIMWCVNFLDDLGVRGIRPCTLYQDNMSTIHIITGGLNSIRRTRHMNMRQLFVKEKVDDGTIVVSHLP